MKYLYDSRRTRFVTVASMLAKIMAVEAEMAAPNNYDRVSQLAVALIRMRSTGARRELMQRRESALVSARRYVAPEWERRMRAIIRAKRSGTASAYSL